MFDPWFIQQFVELIDTEREIGQHTLDSIPPDLLLRAKQEGFGDAYIARVAAGDDGRRRQRTMSRRLRRVFRVSCRSRQAPRTRHHPRRSIA